MNIASAFPELLFICVGAFQLVLEALQNVMAEDPSSTVTVLDTLSSLRLAPQLLVLIILDGVVDG